MALGQIAPKTAGSAQPRKFPWLTLRTAVKSVATLHKKFTKNILGKSFLFGFIFVHHFVSHINGYSWFSIYDSSQNRKKTLYLSGKQDKEFRITKFGVTQLLNEQFVYSKGFFRITNRNTT